MKSYKDPTFDLAARHEARDCTGCEHLLTLWNVSACQKKKWTGMKNMRRCELWKWEEKHV